MANDPRLAGLVRISALVKDMHLAELRRAEAERQALLDRLAALSRPAELPDDLPASVAVDVALRYQRWAELRRLEIETALQRKARDCDAARDRARLSVGRDGALARLTGKT